LPVRTASQHSVDNNSQVNTPSHTTPQNLRGEPSEAQIRHALDQAGGVVSAAARDLGISRQSLYRRLEKFGIKGA